MGRRSLHNDLKLVKPPLQVFLRRKKKNLTLRRSRLPQKTRRRVRLSYRKILHQRVRNQLQKNPQWK
eukprot:2007871-Amphidinium_carterae.1